MTALSTSLNLSPELDTGATTLMKNMTTSEKGGPSFKETFDNKRSETVERRDKARKDVRPKERPEPRESRAGAVNASTEEKPAAVRSAEKIAKGKPHTSQHGDTDANGGNPNSKVESKKSNVAEQTVAGGGEHKAQASVEEPSESGVVTESTETNLAQTAGQGDVTSEFESAMFESDAVGNVVGQTAETPLMSGELASDELVPDELVPDTAGMSTHALNSNAALAQSVVDGSQNTEEGSIETGTTHALGQVPASEIGFALGQQQSTENPGVGKLGLGAEGLNVATGQQQLKAALNQSELNAGFTKASVVDDALQTPEQSTKAFVLSSTVEKLTSKVLSDEQTATANQNTVGIKNNAVSSKLAQPEGVAAMLNPLGEGKVMNESLQNFSQLFGDNTTHPTSQTPTHASASSNAAITPSLSNFASNIAGRVQLPVSITFGENGWANMVAERSAMMASQSLKFAELQLDPPELGPLQVKVVINQDQASVSFVTANANVRDALDQSVARLKELLQEQGIDLVDVDVSDQPSQEPEDEADESGNQLASGEDAESAEHAEKTLQTVTTTYGVDHYA
ncbi:MAG: flagellar hook-length control protein FliK [Agarilytica sp.]